MKRTTSENELVGRVTGVKFFFVVVGCGSAGGHVSGRGEFLAMSTGFFPRINLICTVMESRGKDIRDASIDDWPPLGTRPI